jgi:hypothetical protein
MTMYFVLPNISFYLLLPEILYLLFLLDSNQIKIGRSILLKIPKVKFHQNPRTRSGVFLTTKLKQLFHECA